MKEVVLFVFSIAVTGWLAKSSWWSNFDFFSMIISVIIFVLCFSLIHGLILNLAVTAGFISAEDTPQTIRNHRFAAPRTRRNQRAAAPRAGGLGNQRIDALHSSVLGAFYHRKKGGVIISCGNKHMMAVEFDGPLRDGGIYGEMGYVLNGNSRTLVSQGKKFLDGETFEQITCNENDFMGLLSKYNKQARFTGQTDMKSGLILYSVRISK